MLVGATLAHDGASGRENATAVGALVADEALDPRILELELEGVQWETATGALELALSARDDALHRRDEAVADLIEIRRQRTVLVERLHEHQMDAATLDDRIARHEEALRRRAVERYVRFGDASDLDGLQSPGAAGHAARSRQLAEEVGAAQIEQWRDMRARNVVVGHEIATLEGQILALDRAEEETASAARGASDDLAVGRERVEAETAAVRSARRRAHVAGFDLPVISLDAYLGAAEMVGATHPSCGLEWWLLAAVARVESHHGELGGRRVGEDGDISRPIIGMALDGRPGIRAIADTDDGEVDGDTEWDRAVGPMQFIPETWSRRGVDGNDDGTVDPQNVYDAAAAAAGLLCEGDLHLATPAGRHEALLAYNTSDAYVDEVQNHARRYRSLMLPRRAAGNADSP